MKKAKKEVIYMVTKIDAGKSWHEMQFKKGDLLPGMESSEGYESVQVPAHGAVVDTTPYGKSFFLGVDAVLNVKAGKISTTVEAIHPPQTGVKISGVVMQEGNTYELVGQGSAIEYGDDPTSDEYFKAENDVPFNGKVVSS